MAKPYISSSNKLRISNIRGQGGEKETKEAFLHPK